MYAPSHFNESRIEVLHEFMARHPLALLVATSANGLQANHVPLMLEPGQVGHGTLKGHIARGNSMWKDVSAGAEVLAVFQGPSQYISPNWYPSKREHGRVVPTWNYAVVHVHGRITWNQDKTWLRTLVETLTDRHESGQAAPWRVGDAPDEYIQQMLGAIVGFEIAITRITGKWKLSQNRTAAERAGVVAALSAQPDDASREMAFLIERAGKPNGG